MKYLMLLITIISHFSLFAEKVPSWVPENKKRSFYEYIKSVESVKKSAAEYQKTLESDPKYISCKVEGNSVIYNSKRHKLTARTVHLYSMTPKNCKIEENKVYVEFKNEYEPHWLEVVKDYTIKIGIGVVIAVGVIFL